MTKWVSSSALSGAPDLVAELGGDWDGLLAESGLPAGLSPTSAQLIEIAGLARFLTLAADRLECECFGLRLSHYQGFSVLGPLASLLGSANTIGELLHDLAAYFPVFTVGALVALVESPDGIEVNYELAAGTGLAHRHITELGFGVLVKEIRRHLPGWAPQYVTLRHAPPANRRYHAQLLGPTIYSNADRNTIFIARAELAKPTCEGSVLLHGELAARYDAIRKSTPGAIAANVENLVRAFLPHATMEFGQDGKSVADVAADVAAQIGAGRDKPCAHRGCRPRRPCPVLSSGIPAERHADSRAFAVFRDKRAIEGRRALVRTIPPCIETWSGNVI